MRKRIWGFCFEDLEQLVARLFIVQKFKVMNALTTFSYAGSKITFATKSGVRVNATQMAKPFGKRPVDWLKYQNSQEFIDALCEVRKITSADLVTVIKGGNGEQGTWMHEDVALEFARWLSPKFAIWCNDRIKELLTTPQQPQKAEVLPPPVTKPLNNSALVEVVDGKAVTTSRILARLLGRKHNSVLDTIKNNLGQRPFKYGNFITRPYSTGHSHGYEFLITRKGLDALASMLRYNAKERIAEAYAGAWSAGAKLLPAPVPTPSPVENRVDEPTDASDTIRELSQWIDELRADLRRARETTKMYAEMYENEKRRRERNGTARGHWHDLYHDLLWRLLYDTAVPLHERLAAHKAFSERISVKNTKKL